MIVNGSIDWGDLIVVGVPKGSVFTLTLSDVPNPRQSIHPPPEISLGRISCRLTRRPVPSPPALRARRRRCLRLRERQRSDPQRAAG
jgi:hypothetical protein